MKIATCCHCGTRAMLRHDKGQHTLACANCGAPLRNLKALPVAPPQRAAVSHRPAPLVRQPKPQPKRKPRPVRKKSWRKRKAWFWELAEEAFDFVEDIFD